MQVEDKYITVAEIALDKARKIGVDMAEVYLANAKELTIEVQDRRVETLKLAEERGIGLRIISDGRVGFAFTSDLSTKGIEKNARQAKDNALSSTLDTYRKFPHPVREYPELDLFDPHIHIATIEEKINLAMMMEEEARVFDPRIKIIESSSYQDVEADIVIVNTLGMTTSYRRSYCGVYVALVAEEGEDSQTGFALDYSLKYNDLNPREVGLKAAQRAVRMLGAKPITTRTLPVILEPYVAVGFLSLLASALTGEAVQKGRSLFAGKIGAEVASKLVTIIDDGALPDGIASAPFDGEGVPTSRTMLINKGRLERFLHNTYTALKDGVQSTGNGIRGSFKSTPEVGPTNFFIQPDSYSPQELIQGLEHGLYITEALGMHTANPISGDFSIGVSGILIEGGELKQPVRGVAVAGNVVEMLTLVEGVGNDLQFFGGRGSPTLLISRMTLSGK